MNKDELVKVTLDGKFVNRGWTTKGIAAKKGLNAKTDGAKIEALKKDKANFVEVNVFDLPIYPINDVQLKQLAIAGIAQTLYSIDLGNITKENFYNALAAKFEPRTMDDATKAMMVSWRKVIACLKQWNQDGVLDTKTKGQPLAKVAEKLMLHPKVGAAAKLPDNWSNLVANIESKIGELPSAYDEVELD